LTGRLAAVTIQSYSQAVRNFAWVSTGAGVNHERLAEILSKFALESNYLSPYRPSETIESFLSIYRFKSKTLQHISTDVAQNSNTLRRDWVLDVRTDFPTCKTFYEFKVPSRRESPGQLLFLRGQWSGEWIGLVGSKFQVDPEFFCEFLKFENASDRTNNFSIPKFAAASWNVMKIPLMTIGSYDALNTSIGKNEMKGIRQECAKQMERYRCEINRNDSPRVGNSVVRNYHVFDSTHFAVEQAIWICLQPAKIVLDGRVSTERPMPRVWLILF